MTIDYYNAYADTFFKDTINLSMAEIYKKFLAMVPVGGHILDVGCGSGRDTKAFIQQGYRVTAYDASKELVKRASNYTGMQVHTMTFAEMPWIQKFDGVWACASFLHVAEENLFTILKNHWQALREGGAMYMSFKYGQGQAYRKGRFFQFYTEYSVQQLIGILDAVQDTEIWISYDVRKSRSQEHWLNVILTKQVRPKVK